MMKSSSAATAIQSQTLSPSFLAYDSQQALDDCAADYFNLGD